MDAETIDRDDPEGRAQLTLREFARRQRSARVVGALALSALAGLGPLLAGTVGDGAPSFGAVLASLLLVGCGVAVWPWTWSEAERQHHTMVAIWAQARPTASPDVPWTRYAAWANATDDHVELVLITRVGSADDAAAPSPFAMTVE